MANRKKKKTTKTAKRKTTRRKKKSVPSRALSQVEQRAPTRIGDYLAQLQKRLDGLEKQISAAQDTAMRRATRLLKDASRQIGRLEAARERGWQQLTLRYRTEAARLLRRLEAAIAPPNTGRRPAARRRAQRPRRKA